MTRQELVQAYSSGRINRRAFVTGLTALGVSASAATAYATSLQPAAAAPNPICDELYPPQLTPPQLPPLPPGLPPAIYQRYQQVQDQLNQRFAASQQKLNQRFTQLRQRFGCKPLQ